MKDFGPTIQKLFDLTDRVAVVTGGCLGLGFDEAAALADMGARVVVTSRKTADAEAAAGLLSSRSSVPVKGWNLDVTDKKDVVEFFRRLIAEFGQIDVLVNNAGGAPNSDRVNILDRRLEDWEYVIRTNLTGTFLCSQAAANYMKKRGQGSIINISSISGLLGRDPRMYQDLEMRPNIIDYSAAKAGVLGLTRECAAWLGPFNIRVNAILPGGFERGQPAEFIKRYSDKVPMGRMGRDKYDIKGAIALLSSDAGAYISGAEIVIDGGFSIFK